MRQLMGGYIILTVLYVMYEKMNITYCLVHIMLCISDFTQYVILTSES